MPVVIGLAGASYVGPKQAAGIVKAAERKGKVLWTSAFKDKEAVPFVKFIDRTRFVVQKLRALATQYGDPDELLSYDWIPPLPGINFEGDYLKDYAPDPIAYLKNA